MDRYIEQLIEDFNKAAAQAEPKEIDFGETYEEFEEAMLEIENEEPAPAQEILGVSHKELPPAKMLTDDQAERLIEAIVNALEAQGTSVTFPDYGKAPVKIRYEALREHFKDGFYSSPGWVIDFCTGWCPDCAFVDYCDTSKEVWTKEELEKEQNKQ